MQPWERYQFSNKTLKSECIHNYVELLLYLSILFILSFIFLLMSWMNNEPWISDVSNKLRNKQVSFLKLQSWLNGLPGSHLDIVKWLWMAALISQFQMTRDNQVIKMSPFSTSDTLPLPPHLNNKSALECFFKQEGEKQKDFYLYSKHKHLFVLFSLPTGPPGNLILLIHSHIYTGGGVLAPLKVCSVVLRRPVFVF